MQAEWQGDFCYLDNRRYLRWYDASEWHGGGPDPVMYIDAQGAITYATEGAKEC